MIHDAEISALQATNAYLERERRELKMILWDNYFMAAVSGGCSVAEAEKKADEMLEARRKRWGA